jgi:excisionase family DNA binding protein
VIVGYRFPRPDEVWLGRRVGKDEPLLLTPEQVARRLNISRSMVYLLLADPNGIPSITIGRCRRIRESDLQRWLDEQQSA